MLYQNVPEPPDRVAIRYLVAVQQQAAPVCYALDGRRVNSAYKGIVIINGRKYVQE